MKLSIILSIFLGMTCCVAMLIAFQLDAAVQTLAHTTPQASEFSDSLLKKAASKSDQLSYLMLVIVSFTGIHIGYLFRDYSVRRVNGSPGEDVTE